MFYPHRCLESVYCGIFAFEKLAITQSCFCYSENKVYNFLEISHASYTAMVSSFCYVISALSGDTENVGISAIWRFQRSTDFSNPVYISHVIN